jgi:hypothetical protein
VGYTTAGYLEVKHWQKKHYPIHYDAKGIYARAKAIDPFDQEGTLLKYGVQAAKDLGFVSGETLYIGRSIKSIKFAVLEYGICLGAFNITNEWNLQRRKDGRIAELDFPSFMGGHAVLICGYDEEGLYIQNSWGKKWGIYGFGLVPWKMVEKQFLKGALIKDIELH